MPQQKPEQPEILTPVQARQGRIGRDVLYVLLISLTLAIVAAVVLLTWASPTTPDNSKLGHSLSQIISPVLVGEIPLRGLTFAQGPVLPAA